MRTHGRLSALRIKRADAVEHVRAQLCRCIALALLRDDMEQNGLVARLDELEHIFQPRKVVPIHRAVIGKAHLLKQRRAKKHPLPALLDAVREAVDRSAAGQGARHRAVGFF